MSLSDMASNAIDLALECHAIYTLRLSFSDQTNLEALCFSFGHLVSVPKPVEELATIFSLDRLLGCKQLRKVQWDSIHWPYDYDKPVPDHLERAAESLAMWTKNLFLTYGRRLENIVTWRRSQFKDYYYYSRKYI